MKKLLFVVALGAFAACNSGANADAKKDSLTVDTTKKAVDTTTVSPVDTTKKDTAKSKM